MPMSFYIKSSDALLNCAMWTPAKEPRRRHRVLPWLGRWHAR